MKIKPSKVFEGSSLASSAAENFKIWQEYLDRQNWGPGCRDSSSWNGFLRARSLGVEPNSAAIEVTKRVVAAGGTFDPTKIKSQVNRAYTVSSEGNQELKALIKPPKPNFDPQKLKKVASAVQGIDEKWMVEKSPIPPEALTTEQFLDAIFEPGEKILLFSVFESQGQCLYEVGAASNPAIPFGPNGVWFLSNPVNGNYYLNPRQDNKPSRRSEESVTKWRYMVLENDVAHSNEWLACLAQLPLKIVAIYTSGGKSIHALVRIDATSKADWDNKRDRMKAVLVTLGADPGALTAVRLTRLPGSMRGDKQQKLLYLNPETNGEPIFSKFKQ